MKKQVGHFAAEALRLLSIVFLFCFVSFLLVIVTGLFWAALTGVD